MLPARTPLDHIRVNVMLDIPEMDENAQVNLISSLHLFCRVVLHNTFNYNAAPVSCVAGQLDHLSPITRFNFRLLPAFRSRKKSIFLLFRKRYFQIKVNE